MNWLIITDDENFYTHLSKEIKQIEKSSKVFYSDFSEEKLKKIRKHFDSLSLCIIYKTEDLSLQNEALISALCGFLVGNNVAVLSNNSAVSSFNAIIKGAVKSVTSKDEILKYIKKQYSSISSNDQKRTAKKKLLERGIPFNSDCFAMYIAKNKPEIFNLFISAGIDINSRDDFGTPMLNIAVRNDNEEFAKKLIELGAEINLISEDRGYTAVMDAVWRGNETLTKLLIEKGAELNTISKEGQSNLVLAVGADKVNICKMLAENGADPDIKDQMGMSAYGYATLFKKEKIVSILAPYHKE
ncbi:MAG: ankyrin repeat domain-containing protein [Treponema sp.]|nr:ankyrin repeat domain-containing protein [Treponema sp.]